MVGYFEQSSDENVILIVLPQEANEADFRVRIVGCIENICGLGSGPLDVINLIDIAQVRRWKLFADVPCLLTV